jgi:hypothetical protein
MQNDETLEMTKNLNLDNTYLKLSEYLENPNNHMGFFNLENDTWVVKKIEFDSETFTYSKYTNNVDFIASIENDKNLNLTQYIIENITNIQFIDCKFNKDLIITNELNSLEFISCIFDGRCYINNQYENNNTTITMNNIKIKKTIFNKNFKLHNTIIENFHMVDTDFMKNADFFKSKFRNGFNNKILFNAINFNELALFGDTEFSKLLEFKYVTFKGYTHFRSAIFKEGLDLEYANIEKEMNFFNIHELNNPISKKNTSQETYRIIKYQLQKVGNIIQSNKYQAFELEKRQDNVCNKCSYRSFLDCIVLNIHNISSSHSTNWLLALIWIIVIGISTTYLLGKDMQINTIIQYMSILNRYDEFKINKTISYSILMFNKISLGYLYYQFVTAIRKDTRK